jgi:UPF0755 protein
MKKILKLLNILDLVLSPLSSTKMIDNNLNLRPSQGLILILVGVFFFFFLFFISVPSDFPVGEIIAIEEGATLKEIAAIFKQERLIRSANFFDLLVRYSGYEKEIKAGKYMFSEPLSVIGLMRRLIKGDYGVSLVKITIPEGATINDINKIFSDKGFKDFEIKDKELEGYLFPDTYFFSADTTVRETVSKMTENLKNKITPDLENATVNAGRTFHQVLTMASLIEKEAAEIEDRRLISGILWKRFDEKMPLQVDAAFVYAIGKNTFELTKDDLKIDNPYNTYNRVGLPPTPICNPGLDAILAAIFPEKSPYWYYLSDKEGKVYYSKTFEEHVQKKQKYLR